ncbi:MAG: alkaline phosphatase [Flavobacteriaceae bacterium]
MKKWQKTTFLGLLMLGLFVGLMYVFKYKIVKTSSSNIDFAPEVESKEVFVPDSIQKPENIIFFIADGMGFSHLSLAMMSQQIEGQHSVWQNFEVKSWHDARNTYGPLTDSGASATAMATGTTTFFDVIGQDKDGNNKENVFEIATQNNYATAIVTDSYVWDATPAAFVAHTKSRDNAREILEQIAASELDLLFGELEDVGEDEVPDLETTMEILTQKFTLLDHSLELPPTTSDSKPFAAIFEEDEIQDLDSSPNLLELTKVALDVLSSKDQPFILLVECEEMDSASHANDTERLIKGLQALQSTLDYVQDFAKEHGNTLLLFTADHETGGLAVTAESDDYPKMEIVWSTTNHTAAVVPLLAQGPGAEHFEDVHRNRHIGQVLKTLIRTE